MVGGLPQKSCGEKEDLRFAACRHVQFWTVGSMTAIECHVDPVYIAQEDRGIHRYIVLFSARRLEVCITILQTPLFPTHDHYHQSGVHTRPNNRTRKTQLRAASNIERHESHPQAPSVVRG